MYNKVVKQRTFTASGATWFSDHWWLPMNQSFSVHVVYTSGSGQALLQFSNNGENWVDVSGSEQALSGSSSAFFDVTGTGASAVRLKFIGSAGTTGTFYSCGGVK